MAVLINLEIAKVSFAISCRRRIVLDEPTTVYPFFFKKPNLHSTSGDIHIRLELGEMPGTENLTPIFDTGQSWSLLSDGRDYFLKLYPSTPGKQPLWMARIQRDFTKARVYCGEGLIREKEGKIYVSNPIRYPLDQIMLMYFLAQRPRAARGALFHAAGIRISGRGFMFPGRSGAGKSTLIGHLMKRERLSLLSDDRVIVRRINNRYEAFGTPWPGDAGIAVNESAPLAGILFIHHGTENRIEKIDPARAAEQLLPVTSIPWYDREIMPEILLFCEDMISHVPAYDLHCRPSAEVADVLEKFASA